MSAAYSNPASLSPMPDVGEMPGQASRDDEQGVDPNGVAWASKTRRQAFGRHRDATQSIFIERPRCRFVRATLLYFNESHRPATPCDQVDFAAGNACAAGKDAPTFETQPPGGNRLRPASPRFCKLAAQSAAPSSSARA
jgi:hypothetical protein